MFVRLFLFLVVVLSGYVYSEEIYIPDIEINDIMYADLTDIECLSIAIYHEARGESIQGQRYVAQTIMNRVRSKRFGADTACEVVRQKRQFSFTHDGLTDSVSEDRTAFVLAYVIAIDFFHLDSMVNDEHALDYLYYVNPDKLKRMPNWSSGLPAKKINNHLFMRHDS